MIFQLGQKWFPRGLAHCGGGGRKGLLGFKGEAGSTSNSSGSWGENLLGPTMFTPSGPAIVMHCAGSPVNGLILDKG